MNIKIVSKTDFFGSASETSPLDEIISKENTKIPLKPSPKKLNNDVKFEITRDPEQFAKDNIEINLCLEGLKFGVTGLMNICGREVIEDMVLRHGGKVNELYIINI
jgi:BRCT domain type II-containing protein